MQINRELLIAYRFLCGSKTEKNISIMLKICFFSIFLGVCALTLVTIIMSGFEKETYKKLQSINSDIIIRSDNKAINYKKVEEIINKEFSNTILASSPVGINQVIIQNINQEPILQTAVILKAIEPESNSKVSSLQDMLKTSSKLYNILKNKNNIIIGHKLASNLKVSINDKIAILFPVANTANSITFDSKETIISGIFNIGIDEFDEHLIFCNLELFDELSQSGITEINIKLKDVKFESSTLKSLKERFSLDILTWKDLYPSLLSSLNIEKYVMFIIFFLMAFVTSINIISLIFMFITHKQNDIALLKSFGISESKISRIFILLGSIIILSAGFAGLLSALIIGYIIKYYIHIPLSSTYYVDYLPININLNLILLIILTIFIISFITLLFPIKKIKNIPVIFAIKKK